MTFNSNNAAQEHVHSVNQGGTYLCPLVEEYDCKKTFSWKNCGRNMRRRPIQVLIGGCALYQDVRTLLDSRLFQVIECRGIWQSTRNGVISFGENDHLPIAVQDLAPLDAAIAKGADSDSDPNWDAGEGHGTQTIGYH